MQEAWGTRASGALYATTNRKRWTRRIQIKAGAVGSFLTSSHCWFQGGLMHQQRLRYGQSHGLSLACQTTALYQTKQVVFVESVCCLQRPNSTLAVVQAPEILGERLAVDQDLALALDEPCHGRRRLSSANTLCAAQLVDDTRLRHNISGLVWLLVTLHCVDDLLGHELGMDAVQSPQDVQHLVEALGLDRLVRHDTVQINCLPGHLGRFGFRYCGQRGDLAEQRRQREVVVGEGGLRAEVGWRHGHDAQSSQQLCAGAVLVVAALFCCKVNRLRGSEGLLHLRDILDLRLQLSRPHGGSGNIARRRGLQAASCCACAWCPRAATECVEGPREALRKVPARHCATRSIEMGDWRWAMGGRGVDACDAMRGCRLPVVGVVVVVVVMLRCTCTCTCNCTIAPALARTCPWQQIPAKVGQALDTSALARESKAKTKPTPTSTQHLFSFLQRLKPPYFDCTVPSTVRQQSCLSERSTATA
jgi:hypothetical protein